MMEKKHLFQKRAFVFFISLIAILILVNSFPARAWANQYELPKTIYWAGRYVGAALYTVTISITETIAPVLDRKIRIIPGNDAEMINMMRAGKAHLATFGADNYWASMGLMHYATFAMGPQPLRLVWPGVPDAYFGALCTKESGISKPSDLKGKRAILIKGVGWSHAGVTAALAFAGLTLDDVKVVKVSNTGAMFKALAEGKADWSFGSATSASAYEIEASPYGLYLLPFSFENKEGWKKIGEIIPYSFPRYATMGASIKKGERIPCPGWAGITTTTLADRPVELIYAICKAIHGKLDKLIASYPPNEALRVEKAILPECTILAPYHPGAIKFFKEIGVWTEEHEAANQKRIAHLKKVHERWDRFVEESGEEMKRTKKKIKPADVWPEIVKKEIGLKP